MLFTYNSFSIIIECVKMMKVSNFNTIRSTFKKYVRKNALFKLNASTFFAASSCWRPCPIFRARDILSDIITIFWTVKTKTRDAINARSWLVQRPVLEIDDSIIGMGVVSAVWKGTSLLRYGKKTVLNNTFFKLQDYMVNLYLKVLYYNL